MANEKILVVDDEMCIRDRFNALEGALGKLPIIAEDLGELFPSVREPVSYTHLDVYKRQVIRPSSWVPSCAKPPP